MHIEQQTDSVFHHQTCQAQFGQTRGPIGKLSEGDRILAELKQRLESGTMPTIICPKHTSLTEITNEGDLTLNFMFMQPTVYVNDFEKIRYSCNPSEVNTLLGVAYNLINDEEELQLMVAEKIERAYEKVKGMSWEKIAKQFKVKIDKLAK
jgi:hypothetical protein